jgi:hypothetical protein
MEWTGGRAARDFRTGVSIHSHTLHSKEGLDFIYTAARSSRLLQWVVSQGERRYQELHNAPLDLRRGWWTPPLSPADAYRLEAGQITGLDLAPLVSLSDHDDIEAPMSLQAIEASRPVPVSVEWTVPYRQTFFHIGVHNLPPAQARETMARLANYTAEPTPASLSEILADLHATPEALVIFNHPMWDEKGIGGDLHRAFAIDFMGRYGAWIHAIEMNGLRPWKENRRAFDFAAECGKPVISGGDRHTLEPNAVLNLTSASTFSEFVDEIRVDKQSDVWVASVYRQSHAYRLFHNMLDVFRTYDDHGLGWRQWSDRVFFQLEDGSAASLSHYWGTRPPAAVGIFASFMSIAGCPPLRHALRATMSRSEEVVFEA